MVGIGNISAVGSAGALEKRSELSENYDLSTFEGFVRQRTEDAIQYSKNIDRPIYTEDETPSNRDAGLSKSSETQCTYGEVLCEHLRYLRERDGRKLDFEGNKSSWIMPMVGGGLVGIASGWLLRIFPESNGVRIIAAIFGGFVCLNVIWTDLTRRFNPDAMNKHYRNPRRW